MVNDSSIDQIIYSEQARGRAHGHQQHRKNNGGMVRDISSLFRRGRSKVTEHIVNQSISYPNSDSKLRVASRNGEACYTHPTGSSEAMEETETKEERVYTRCSELGAFIDH